MEKEWRRGLRGLGEGEGGLCFLKRMFMRLGRLDIVLDGLL